MKTIILIFTILFAGLTTRAQDIAIIPKPLKAVKNSSAFALNQQTQIVANKEALKIAEYLQTELLKYQGIALRSADKATANYIDLQIKPNAKQALEAYQLSIGEKKIEIKAANPQGLFAGVTSLLQLIRQQPSVNHQIAIPSWNIEDQPRYAWRGVMLDESRHFFGKEKVKQILDWMAFYKLNKFHWHLTDQPGWRIEIKKYPKLTVIGGVGSFTDSLAKAQYYTQEEIKEIVRYAAERFIDVIPEIDMPGHATAANKAYPEFSGGGSPKYPEFTFNPGKEGTYQYLTDILREVDALFPSQMIHIGADEVHFGNQHWNKDEAVQALMKKNNFKDLPAVEAYFVKRIADSIKALNNEVLAWDEIVSGNLSSDQTTVFWWRHDKPEILKQALEKGFKVVLCPRSPLYFDFVQDSAHVVGRKWAGKFVPLKSVYDFPSKEITDLPNANSLIRGIQANIWTEVIVDEQQLDFKLFPRIAALAEAAWTNTETKNVSEFNNRLKKHFEFYTADGLYFFNPFNTKASPELLTPAQRKGLLPDNEAQTAQEKGTIK
ncbi:beta-N-acetylhexosaminidase [Pedobacter xixiisoli]|uniref:beta-N-acetylhexosaminidase n=1 Tax=Pedobacter xixiisoli TaxID=1476464 RepID=A0A285ZPD0_9SPHI|nr:beta-N-acetylhexosaminidase [Pedobacter xixiisoli]SOD11497.1 hexosaminidase [Pedobacter xixiisoli]